MKTKASLSALLRVSAVLLISSAGLVRAEIALVGPDTTTQGSWNGKFGQDGFLIANGASRMPSYGTASVSGASTYTWASLTSDVRALQSAAGASSRMASTYYGYNFNVNVSVGDGALHPVSLYFLDWDTTTRSLTATVLDADTNTVLDVQTVTGFNGGKYLTWNVRGNIRINVSANKGDAVLSGVFFGLNSSAAPVNPSGSATSATPIGPDTATQGNWKGKYGSEGYYVAGGISQAPSYGSATVTGASNFTWAYNTTDQRGLQNFDAILGPIHTASTYYANNFGINVGINDGNAHQVSLYVLDWDQGNAPQTIKVYDAASGALLDSQTLTGTGSGKYFSWTIKGNVRFAASSTGYNDALVGGIFFGAGGTISSAPADSASGNAAKWVGLDTATQGTWTGKYGAAGYMMANGPSATPSYANSNVAFNYSNYTWAGGTTDVRALQTAAGSANRMAATYGTFKIAYFEFRVNVTDGNAHNVSLYLLDWDSYSRPEMVNVIDAGTNQLLDSRTFDGYHDGVWATWNVKGSVVFRIVPIGETYAAVSGLFFN